MRCRNSQKKRKRWSLDFVTSINMVILTFTFSVLCFLVLYFPLTKSWKHHNVRHTHTRLHSHTQTHTDTHQASEKRFHPEKLPYLPTAPYLFILALTFWNINYQIILSKMFPLMGWRPCSLQTIPNTLWHAVTGPCAQTLCEPSVIIKEFSKENANVTSKHLLFFFFLNRVVYY